MINIINSCDDIGGKVEDIFDKNVNIIIYASVAILFIPILLYIFTDIIGLTYIIMYFVYMLTVFLCILQKIDMKYCKVIGFIPICLFAILSRLYISYLKRNYPNSNDELEILKFERVKKLKSLKKLYL